MAAAVSSLELKVSVTQSTNRCAWRESNRFIFETRSRFGAQSYCSKDFLVEGEAAR